MPITPFLNGERFDPESERILGVAFEMVCIALRIGDCDDGVKQAIASKIIDLAKAGQRNPDLLCGTSIEGHSQRANVGRLPSRMLLQHFFVSQVAENLAGRIHGLPDPDSAAQRALHKT
jgi:hypothetical protein